MSIPCALQRLIEQLEAFDRIPQDVTIHLEQMQDWQSNLTQALQHQLIQNHSFAQQSKFAGQISAVNHSITDQIASWQSHCDALKPAQDLAHQFGDKIILLIFGKFNAGKSSLCNVIADGFRQIKQSVQYFYLDTGQICADDAPFKEGATETTARLQGVSLGNSLVLLDTPGLHSVTAENAELTQRFIESADGMLWLTSSSSPGQVKELDALAQELHRHKPLLPVITRSDYFEEDEVDGEICQVLCNKSTAQRALQAQDVGTRATEKLIDMGVSPTQLQVATSISAQMLKTTGFTAQALLESGFDDFFTALDHLIQPAVQYKQRKPAETHLHYLQEQIVLPLQTDIMPQLLRLQQHIRTQAETLPQHIEQLIQQSWRTIIPNLPTQLEQHAKTQNLNALCAELNQQVEHMVSTQIDLQLADYQLQPDPITSIQLAAHIHYDLIYAENGQDIISIGHDRLYTALSQHIVTIIRQHADHLRLNCQKILTDLQLQTTALQHTISTFTEQLAQIATQMRLTDRSISSRVC